MMRKLIFSFFILLVIFVLGVVFFLKKFDADRFRPQLVEEIERVVGNPVKLGKLSLAWRGGIALNVDGLEVYQRGTESQIPAIAMEKAGAVLQPLPLLKKQIKLASLTVRKPRLEMILTKQGALQITGINPQTQPSAEPEKSQIAPAMIPLTFLIHAISVQEGQVTVRDERGALPVVIPIRNLNLTLKNVSLGSNGDLHADGALDASVFSQKKNLEFSGKMMWQISAGTFELGNARGEFDLAGVDVKELTENVPSAKAAAIQTPLAGEIKMNIDRLSVSPDGLRDIELQVSMNGGQLRTASLAAPIEAVDLKATIDEEKLSLEALSAKLAGGTVRLSGTLTDWKGEALSAMKADVENIALENFLPPVSAKEPQLHGRIGVSFEGNASGLKQPDVAKTLSGTGKYALKDGVIINFNLLRSLLEKLSMFPGLVGQIESSLPENLKEKFKKNDTVIEAVERPYQIREGKLMLSDFGFKTDTLEAKGSAEAALDGQVSGKINISIARDLSEAIDRQVPKLKYLEDSGGRVVIPVMFQGGFPKMMLVPDIQDISGRLATHAAADWVGEKLLKKKTGEPAGAKPSDLSILDDFIKTAANGAS